MKYLIILAILLSSPNILASMNVEVDSKECIVKVIRYAGIHSYVHFIGKCEDVYTMCTRDSCDVDKIEQKDLNFGGREDIGAATGSTKIEK